MLVCAFYSPVNDNCANDMFPVSCLTLSWSFSFVCCPVHIQPVTVLSSLVSSLGNLKVEWHHRASVLSSGTLGAAMEASLAHRKAIALSFPFNGWGSWDDDDIATAVEVMHAQLVYSLPV